MPPINKFVIDTSALLALRGDESGADRVEGIFAQAKRNRCELLASFMSRMEILYIDGEQKAKRRPVTRYGCWILSLFQWISCEPSILEIACHLKAGGRLSVADSWIGATALAYGATLVHKDPEFEPFKEIPQEIPK